MVVQAAHRVKLLELQFLAQKRLEVGGEVADPTLRGCLKCCRDLGQRMLTGSRCRVWPDPSSEQVPKHLVSSIFNVTEGGGFKTAPRSSKERKNKRGERSRMLRPWQPLLLLAPLKHPT